MNPYEILGVKSGSSDEEIRAAYEARMKEFDPERYPASHDIERKRAAFKRNEAEEAYKMLMPTDNSKNNEAKHTSDNTEKRSTDNTNGGSSTTKTTTKTTANTTISSSSDCCCDCCCDCLSSDDCCGSDCCLNSVCSGCCC